MKNVMAENISQYGQKPSVHRGRLSCPFPKEDRRNTVPAAGNRNGTDVYNRGSYGNYWSGTLNNSNNAYNLNFNDNNWNWNNNWREHGFSVRPVAELTKLLPSGLQLFHLTREQLLTDLVKAYKDARRHKRKTINQLRFELRMEEELVKLRDSLWTRSYYPGRCTCFVINDPTKREIFAADFRDRVVHHLFYNYSYTLFERMFIADSYSCRKKKGTHYGVYRLEHYLRSCSSNYCNPCYELKMDLKGYFMNINRKRLLWIVQKDLMNMAAHTSDCKGIKWAERVDYPFLFYLAETIILRNPIENCIIKGSRSDWAGLPPSKSLFTTREGCGLPIGNLTSQLFSNVYLNEFDQWMKRTLHCGYYGRYVDDAFVLSRNRDELKRVLASSSQFLEFQLGLNFNIDKTRLLPALRGMTFLGTFVKPFRTYFSTRTRSRLQSEIKMLPALDNPKELRSHINALLGLMRHRNTYKWRNESFIQQKIGFEHGYYNLELTVFKLNENEKN